MLRRYVMLGGIYMFLSVALGAFGAHALKAHLSADMMNVWETGVHYHMIHALGLFLVAFLGQRLAAKKLVLWAGRLFAWGIVLFAGSLYVLAITNISILGAITPLGGICFLLGWLFIVIAAAKETKNC